MPRREQTNTMEDRLNGRRRAGKSFAAAQVAVFAQHEAVLLAAKSLPESSRPTFVLRVARALQTRDTSGVVPHDVIRHTIDAALAEMAA